jgi:hypothetical protein
VTDVRFIASRTLAFGLVAAALTLVVIGIDSLFSTRLPASRVQASFYAGLAVLVGFFLNATYRSVGKRIDFLFFRQWYRTQEQAAAISDTMLLASDKTDLYEPLTARLAEVFSLASVALFERSEDGGFVRVAAWGWPGGTIWHILPDNPLVARAGGCVTSLEVEALQCHEGDVPTGAALPVVMLPIVFAKRVFAILLCGSHNVGTALHRDELRSIGRSCLDAALIYGRSSSAPWLPESRKRQGESLGAEI